MAARRRNADMRVAAVIQARMSSRRLPGKILLKLGDRPALAHMLDGLGHAEGLDMLAVATSTDPSDDATAAFAAARGVRVLRGALDDVARRLLRAGEALEADAIVRVNGDSPFLDPALVSLGISLWRESPASIVTNVFPRTFPKGQSVEVLPIPQLRAAVERMASADEREHVTKYVYAHPEAFSIRTFSADPPRPDVNLCIDDAGDLQRCEAILEVLPTAPWKAGWRACVAAYDDYEIRRGAS